MKEFIRRTGRRLLGHRREPACDIAIEEPSELVEATFWAEPRRLRLHLPASSLRMQGGYTYDAQHPFVAALRDGRRALESFYERTRPTDLRDWYGLARCDEPGGDLPPWELPWYGRDRRTPPPGEGHLDPSHGVSFYGPASGEKVAYEMHRLMQTQASIAKFGYRPDVHGDIEGYVLSAGGRACFFVRGGKHRAAVLYHLGYTAIPVTFRAIFPRLIDEGTVAHWPLVRQGVMGPKIARAVLHRYTHPEICGEST